VEELFAAEFNFILRQHLDSVVRGRSIENLSTAIERCRLRGD
jgi:hypothetical protein